MEESIYEHLIEQIKDIPLEPVPGEPAGADSDELRAYRMEALLKQVRKMALKRFFQMPDSFRKVNNQDDWIQEAMILFCQHTQDYDKDKGSFENYIRFMISRRLISLQRTLFRKNPPVDDELLKLAASIKREKGEAPSTADLADLTGRSEASVRSALEAGGGPRVFTEMPEDGPAPKDVKIGVSPEDQYIRHETRKILWGCINRLDPLSKLLFVRHEFYEVSLRELYSKLLFSTESLSTFQRTYKRNIYGRVQRCVKSRLG